MAKLNPDALKQELQSLPGWEFRDDSISKLYRFNEFLEGIEFVNRIARIAEADDHHPDIHIGYTRIRFVCTTHSAGGVSEKDIKLARKIEEAFAGKPS